MISHCVKKDVAAITGKLFLRPDNVKTLNSLRSQGERLSLCVSVSKFTSRKIRVQCRSEIRDVSAHISSNWAASLTWTCTVRFVRGVSAGAGLFSLSIKNTQNCLERINTTATVVSHNHLTVLMPFFSDWIFCSNQYHNIIRDTFNKTQMKSQ